MRTIAAIVRTMVAGGAVAAWVLGLLTYEVVVLGLALLALCIGLVALWKVEQQDEKIAAIELRQGETATALADDIGNELDGG